MLRLGVASLVGLVSCHAALGQQYTTLNAPAGGEMGHADILALALGGSFSASGSLDFSNGSIFADRNRDIGGVHDQVWQPDTYHLTMVARETDNTHSFGFIKGGAQFQHPFNPLLRSDEIGSSTTVDIGTAFRWAIDLDDEFGGALLTSRDNDNAGRLDAMVSYKLYDAADELFGYALFFDDGTDRDFNDVAVILSLRPLLAPTPQAATLGLLGLGGMSVLAGRRRRSIS